MTKNVRETIAVLIPTNKFMGVSLNENFSLKFSSFIIIKRYLYRNLCKSFFFGFSTSFLKIVKIGLKLSHQSSKVSNSLEPLYQIKRNRFFLLLLLALVTACSPTKNRWINRNWHTLTGHYNIYFNAEQKLLDVKSQIEASHQDNFNQILEVIPYGTPESAKAAGNLIDEASKKYSGTIALHQIGKFTDDAYFGIAKCFFYKRDYYSAIEAFQYVGTRYKNSIYKNLIISWMARSYVGLDKIEEAEAIIGEMLTRNNLNKKEIAHVYTTAADINVRLAKYQSAIDNLNKVLTGKINKEEKIRYHFILGQLCIEAGKKPLAAYHFQKVIALLPAYDFNFNATINMVRCFELTDKKSLAKVRRNLKRMASDDKNIDYLGQIYFELARLEMNLKNDNEAIKYFKLSSVKCGANTAQKAITCKELAQLYFKKKSYKNAQAYYDTCMLYLDAKNKHYEQVKTIQITLKDLINNLQAFETEDSLQQLALLSSDELSRKVDVWMVQERKRQEALFKQNKKIDLIAESMKANEAMPGTSGGLTPLPGTGNVAWYFYNQTLINGGAAEFFSNKKWGQRANEDFWKIASREKVKAVEQSTEKGAGKSEEVKSADKEKKMASDVKNIDDRAVAKVPVDAAKEEWIKHVPFTKEQLKTSNARVLEALNNLGEIYHDKIKDYDQSIFYYIELEKRFPLNEYEPKAYYYLYKNFQVKDSVQSANYYKDLLIKEYPEHPYALILQKKNFKNNESDQNAALNKAYETMLLAFQNGQCDSVSYLKRNLDKDFPGNIYRAKCEYMLAMCVGKNGDKAAFKQSLQSIVAAFPEHEVSVNVKAILAAMDKEQKRAEVVGSGDSANQVAFDLETDVPYYYFLGVKNEKIDLTDYLAAFSNHNESYLSNASLRVNAMLSNEGYQLIVVREFKNLSEANDYLETLNAIHFVSDKLKCKDSTMQSVISIKNFRAAMKDKKLAAYVVFYPKLAATLKKNKK